MKIVGKLYLRVRYPAAFLCVIAGYGFACAENWLTAFACAGLGIVLAAGPEAFYRFLNHLRESEDDALDGIGPDGEYVGDGVPRDQGGHEYEPLEWSGVRRV